MDGSASTEINKLGTPEKTGPVVDRITSPEKIHHDTASNIKVNLEAAGHHTTIEHVRNDQTFEPTLDLKQVGVEPSGGMSAEDVLRVVTEDLGSGDSGTHRVVTGKGRDAVMMKRGKGHRPKKASFFSQLGFKRAA